jgi:hypothetical protein
LFGAGEFAAYGALIQAALPWRLDSLVVGRVQRILRDIPAEDTKIGVHARHQTMNNRQFKQTDDALVNCIAKVLEKAPSSACTLLLATDRLETVLRIKKEMANGSLKESRGCSLQQVLTVAEDADPAHRGGEHGPFSPLDALADIYMLSKADMFLGTPFSTFSIYAAAWMVADSGVNANRIVRHDTCQLWDQINGRPGSDFGAYSDWIQGHVPQKRIYMSYSSDSYACVDPVYDCAQAKPL